MANPDVVVVLLGFVGIKLGPKKMVVHELILIDIKVENLVRIQEANKGNVIMLDVVVGRQRHEAFGLVVVVQSYVVTKIPVIVPP
ncbi:hypothetical protein DGG96_08400 [Legionella qingyii]|uniref:Uncharacterized protein n=1 Tax=Legionella qingyii TaxID=2184757 RepID=A0A317U272_9GAMM|nr:hypothetical protein DGG96_08400 [Legionella qingyii]